MDTSELQTWLVNGVPGESELERVPGKPRALAPAK